MDRCRSPAHRQFVSCQRPRSCELVGGKGFEPNRSPGGERGYGPSADHPLVPPLLATAACVTDPLERSKTEPPCDLARALSRGLRPK
jgi:hypothetical protein